MKIKWVVRFWLVVLLAAAFLTFRAALARADGWPTKYQHFSEIRATVKRMAPGMRLEMTLTNGDRVVGSFVRYEASMDYIWYQPLGTGHNWFLRDAVEVHEVLSVDVTGPV